MSSAALASARRRERLDVGVGANAQRTASASDRILGMRTLPPRTSVLSPRLVPSRDSRAFPGLRRKAEGRDEVAYTRLSV